MLPMLEFEEAAIESAIKAAELRTTGEIRVCVERRRYGDLDARAREVFERLGMTGTPERNGVLFYAHLKERRLIVLGDSGIDGVVPPGFWQSVCDTVTTCFQRKEMTVGMVLGIMLAAEQLAIHFPAPNAAGPLGANKFPDAVVQGDSL